MATFGDKIQALMDEYYNEWKKEENNSKSKWNVLDRLSVAHQIAVVLGNFNYQVENGGLEQWIYNGYFHDDAEKLIEYLEAGKELDDRCNEILNKVYMLDKYAHETECDRDGYYYDPDNDGDSSFIGDMVNCETFDTWYYEHCGEDDWWKTVCGIIEKVAANDIASINQNEVGGGDSPSRPLQVYIENIHDDRIGGFTMPLPTTIAEMQPFLDSAEIAGAWDMKLWEVYMETDNGGGDYNDQLTEAMKSSLSPDTLNELNYLAARIVSLDEHFREIFYAVIEDGRHCDTLAKIINLTFPDNINRFDIQPAFNEKDYGEFLLDMYKDETYGIFDRLEKSENPDERAFAQYILRLEAHIDSKALGRGVAKEENGVFTEHGYLTESKDEFKTIYRGPEDIPAEYRIFAEQTAIPLVKLEDANIYETLLKLYAVCGDHMVGGAAYKMKALTDGKDTDYLLMVNNGQTVLSSAVDAYKRGNYVLDTVAEWSQKADARFFAVRVTERGKDGDGVIIGDFIELNGKALDSNVTRHAISPDRIDATMTDGSKRSFDLWSWADMPIPYRGNIISSEKHFAENDIQAACRSFEKCRDESAGECRTVSAADLLCSMNSAYMSDAQNPQPDMLRITNEAAKQILARGDADVYRLTQDGAVRLAPIEAAKALCFAENKELAIKRADTGSLDKWAKYAAKDVFRQNERDKRDKSKTTGEEL